MRYLIERDSYYISHWGSGVITGILKNFQALLLFWFINLHHLSVHLNYIVYYAPLLLGWLLLWRGYSHTFLLYSSSKDLCLNQNLTALYSFCTPRDKLSLFSLNELHKRILCLRTRFQPCDFLVQLFDKFFLFCLLEVKLNLLLKETYWHLITTEAIHVTLPCWDLGRGFWIILFARCSILSRTNILFGL